MDSLYSILPLSRYRLPIIILLSFITFFVNLGSAPIYLLDEAKNAQCAREMFENHNWIVPTFNQKLRTDKPPLHYYVMGAAYTAFGINAFSARLGSAVCGLLVILLVYFFAAKYADTDTGFLSSFILLCSIHFTLEMRMAVPDPYLIFLMTASLCGFYAFYASAYKNDIYLWSFYITLGLGMLCKGPVAILLPVIIAITFLLFRKSFHLTIIAKFKPLIGLIIIIAIALPWYYMVNEATHGEWTRGFFVNHNIQRFTHKKEGHGGFFFLTIVLVFAGMLPVSIFLWPVIKHAYKNAKANPLIQFCSIIAIAIILFFTFSKTKLPNYAIPCYPFLSILFAGLILKLMRCNISLKRELIMMMIMAIAIPAVVYIVIKQEEALAGFEWLSYLFLLLPIGVVIALLMQLTKNSRRTSGTILVLLSSFMVTGWLVNLVAFPIIYKHTPVENSAKQQLLDEPVAAFQIYNPAFNFKLKHPVNHFFNADSLNVFLQQHPNAAVITHEQYLPGLKKLPLTLVFQQKDMFERRKTCILKYDFEKKQ